MLDLKVLKLSLEFGGGDPNWFHTLDRDTQVRVLALDRIRNPPKSRRGGGGARQLSREDVLAMQARDQARAARRGSS